MALLEILQGCIHEACWQHCLGLQRYSRMQENSTFPTLQSTILQWPPSSHEDEESHSSPKAE